MNDRKIIELIQKYSLTVRCLPKTVTSLWSFQGDYKFKLKNNQNIIEHNGRKYIKTVREVERAGWWYVTESKNTDSIVHFSKGYKVFFAPTLEEAIQLFLESIKN